MVFSFKAWVIFSLASTSLAAPFSNHTTARFPTGTGVRPSGIRPSGIYPTGLSVTGFLSTSEATPAPAPAIIAAVAAPAGPAPATTKTTFTGDGSPGSGWPTIDKWVSYDKLLSNNQKILSASCTQFQLSKDNNTPDETKQLNSSIQSVAASTKVDPRFILAVVMQESKGCVRVHDTVSPDGSVRNIGLMQDHNGATSCASGVIPCPASSITQMITDGTNGTLGITGGGDGLMQTLAQAATDGLKDAQAVYAAARIYNSGSYVVGTDLGAGAATASYASDIANRLMGLAF